MPKGGELPAFFTSTRGRNVPCKANFWRLARSSTPTVSGGRSSSSPGLKVTSARVHKGNVIAKLEGVDDVNAAMLLKGKTVHIRRSDAKLPEGSFFLADLIGLDVVDEHGQKLGVLREVLSPSRQLVYVVEGDREIMIPAVPEFILETNIPEGYVKVRLIEGM